MHETRDDRLLLVLDTTVLSNFATVRRVDLLAQYCGNQAATTASVIQEIEQGAVRGYDYLRPIIEGLFPTHPSGWLHIVDLQSPEERAAGSEHLAQLGRGEASCIAVAVARNLTLATDDLAARRVAQDLSVRLTGTVGILAQLVRTEIISLAEGNAILQHMVAQGYRSPVDVMDQLL